MGVTIKDIAKEAGVSVSAVSRAINGSGYVKKDKLELILHIADKYGYKRKAKKATAGKGEIDVVLPDFLNPFYEEITKGIIDAMDARGYTITIFDTNQNFQKEKEKLREAFARRPEGIIFSPVDSVQERAELKRTDIPVVLIDREVKHTSIDSVLVDSGRGCYKAIEALINEGHRDIAILGGSLTTRSGVERLKSCKQAFIDNGISFNEDRYYDCDFKWQNSYETVKRILSEERMPTAIFSESNKTTLGCLRALTEMNIKVPQDISVIGFNDFLWFEMLNYDISFVRRHTVEVGEEASKRLIELIEAREAGKVLPAKCSILTPTIVLHGSEKKTK